MIKNSQFTISMGVIWAVIATVSSIFVSYYTSLASVNDKINNTTSAIYADMAKDQQRITAVETDINTIKDLQTETRNDIKEILKAVK